MKPLQSLICLIFLLPLPVLAQVGSDDDPFKRDPIFTKPLDDFFGTGDPEEETGKDAEQVIRRLSVSGIDLGGSLEAGPYYSNELYSQYPNLPMFHFNRVNGLFLGIRKERMQWHRYGSFLDIPQIQPHGFIGYGTASKRWEYALGAEKKIGRNNYLMIGGEFYRATGTEDYRRTGLTENTLSSLFTAYDFMDYHLMDGFGLYAVQRTDRYWEAAFSFNRDTFSSLQQKTSYSLFGKSGAYRPNPPVDALSDEIALDRFAFSLAFNPRTVLLADRFTFSADAGAELAENPGSDEFYRYNKYWSTLKLYYNFEPGSMMKWRIRAGGITGNAPDFKKFYLGGIGTLRGSPYKVFEGNQMISSNLEVQFGRPSARPDEWVRDYDIHLVLFLDSGWARMIPGQTATSNPFEGFREFTFSDLQHDAGAGIGTGAFRFEIAWPLKTFDRTPGIWFRFNPTF